jgi:hypothetical protein
VLVFEPIGALRYSEQFDSYWGGTLVLAYPDSGGLAPGVMLHHSSIGHVAGLYRPGGGAAAMLSLDLYRFLSGAQNQLKTMKEKVFTPCLANVATCLTTVNASK